MDESNVTIVGFFIGCIIGLLILMNQSRVLVDSPSEPKYTLVIIESPYAGDINKNVEYARRAMLDSLNRYEAPIASHLLYTQPGVLDDTIPEQRKLGIEAGLAWRKKAEKAVFYIDLGWSKGMLAAKELYEKEGIPIEYRRINNESVK